MQDREVHHCMVAAAEAALNLHILNQSLFVCQYKVQQHASPCWLPHYLHQKVIIDAVQQPPGLYVLGCVVFPADVRVVEVPHENQGLWLWGCLQLPVEGLINFLLLVRWPVAHTHSNVPRVSLSLNSNPQALNSFLICPQAKLMVFSQNDTIWRKYGEKQISLKPVNFHLLKSAGSPLFFLWSNLSYLQAQNSSLILTVITVSSVWFN